MVFAVVDGFLLHAAMDVIFSPPGELADRVWRVIGDRLLNVRRAPVPGVETSSRNDFFHRPRRIRLFRARGERKIVTGMETFFHTESGGEG